MQLNKIAKITVNESFSLLPKVEKFLSETFYENWASYGSHTALSCFNCVGKPGALQNDIGVHKEQ